MIWMVEMEELKTRVSMGLKSCRARLETAKAREEIMEPDLWSQERHTQLDLGQ